MVFVELRFFAFFAVVLAVHWLLRGNTARKIWLLAVSYVFYGAWDWRFLSLIFLTTAIDFAAALRIEASSGPAGRKRWLMVSMVSNLAVLGFFKYFGFFAESLAELARLAGLHVSPATLSIVLPVGISFYTFQTMSYTIDVYRGTLRARRSFLDVSLFVAFFPQLVAGPIVRAADLLWQFDTRREPGMVLVRPSLILLLVGFVKKACIADNISPYVDAYFANPAAYDALSSWIAVLLYAVQIYCDFSGYSDMAIATAGLLGYELMLNFNAPYFATGISEFWHRWHISLSTWLRDYLYIPLGGNRGSRLRQHVNLMTTMLLGGLWHGAAWRFVVWGGLHGVALAVEREWRRLVPETSALRRLVAPLGMALTFYWVCVTWIPFRAHSTEHMGLILKAFVLFQAPGTESLPLSLLGVFAGLAILHALARVYPSERWWREVPVPVFSAAYGVTFALALSIVPTHTSPFIYFQF